MKKWIIFALACAVAACTPAVRLSPVAGTQPADFSFLCKKRFAQGQPAQKTLIPGELDVRSCDISTWDFTTYTADELADVLSFDSKTKFPPKNKLPKGFSAAKILKQNQNPGLGLRALHKQGITGKGVSVAIMDQNLLLDHEQYADRIRYYWQDPFYQQYRDSRASMHGPAVASILAGKTVGVAPQADVYYWAEKLIVENDVLDAAAVAKDLERILLYNFGLPPEKQICVVSISRGFGKSDKGYDTFKEMVAKLAERNIAVFTTNDVFTLSRTHSLAKPDTTDTCRPAYWAEQVSDMYDWFAQKKQPLVPTDFRATAAPNGVRDYVHYANGGLSWAVPYLAGLYALGVQVYPDLTKETFLNALRETADTKECTYQGQAFTARYVVNPAAFIRYLQGLN